MNAAWSITARHTNRIVVIGVGNPYRCDDGVGVEVARRIGGLRSDVSVIAASGEGAALMDLWKQRDQVFLIDAVRSGGRPGRIRRLDALKERIPSDFFNYSTHAFSVAEAVEMSRALNSLPARLTIYGIEGQSFEAGQGLSDAVDAAVGEVVQRILAELGPDASSHEPTTTAR